MRILFLGAGLKNTGCGDDAVPDEQTCVLSKRLHLWFYMDLRYGKLMHTSFAFAITVMAGGVV